MKTSDSVLFLEALEQRRYGADLYHDSRLRESSSVLRGACQLAMACGKAGESLEDDCRFWLGASLHGEGRIAEALAAWGPAVNRLADGALTTDRYMAVTRYLLVMLDLPRPYPDVLAALDEVEEMLKARVVGLAGHRSRLLVARGRLALLRGESQAALDTLSEALAERRRERISYSYSTFMRALAEACWRLGDLDRMEEYLVEWDDIERQYLESKRLVLGAWRANRYLSLGDPDSALEVMLPLEYGMLTTPDMLYRVDCGCAMVRACIAAGVPDRARSVMARLAQDRHCGIGRFRFDIRKVHAEFVLAKLDSGRRHPVKRGRAVDRAVAATRLEAHRLDQLLECGRFNREVDALEEAARART